MRAVHNARAGAAALARAKRGAGSGIASLGAGSSEMARNQIRVRRGIVVSCLQQAALFAVDSDCVPRIDHDRRNDPPPVVCGIEEQRERVERHLPRLGWLGSQQGRPDPFIEDRTPVDQEGGSIDHLRLYVELLFQSAKRKGKEAL
jgi:hypothetical protein